MDIDEYEHRVECGRAFFEGKRVECRHKQRDWVHVTTKNGLMMFLLNWRYEWRIVEPLEFWCAKDEDGYWVSVRPDEFPTRFPTREAAVQHGTPVLFREVTDV